MGENTAISWADHTFNPWIGCQKVGPACDGCYAEARMAKRFKLAEWGPHAERKRTSASTWAQPRKWDRAAAAAGTRPFVFCASLSDVFDNKVPPEWRRDLFDLIRETPNLVWLLLTKRPQNIVSMSKAAGGLPKNAALGCTVVTQAEANRDLKALFEAAVAVNPLFIFVSIEPILGEIKLTELRWTDEDAEIVYNALTGEAWVENSLSPSAYTDDNPKLGWVICGGETGWFEHEARPAHPDWIRVIRDDCTSALVPFDFKQWGDWLPVDGPRWPVSQARSGRGTTRMHRSGRIDPNASPYHAYVFDKVGKEKAGCTLDGIIQHERPVVPHV